MKFKKNKKEIKSHLQNSGNVVPTSMCIDYLTVNFNVLQSQLVWPYAYKKKNQRLFSSTRVASGVLQSTVYLSERWCIGLIHTWVTSILNLWK